MSVRSLHGVACLPLLLGVVGCPSSETVGANAVAVLGAGVVNNPKNKSLRFDVLKFGLERFCQQMTQLSVPLKLSDDQPVIGRFYADTCSSQVLDNEQRKSLVVQYTGKGYAWTNVTKRVGFRAAGLTENGRCRSWTVCASRIAPRIGLPPCRSVNNNASPWPVHWPTNRACCWPMNRQRISIRGIRKTSWT